MLVRIGEPECRRSHRRDNGHRLVQFTHQGALYGQEPAPQLARGRQHWQEGCPPDRRIFQSSSRGYQGSTRRAYG
jgi:hypothetical protein